VEYSNLFEPIKIGNKKAPNRFVINAMECNDADEEGNPTQKVYNRYRKLLEGGSGVVVVEALNINDRNLARKSQLSIMPRNAEPLKEFVTEMKKVNPDTILLFQLTSAGELANPEFSERYTVKPLPGFEGGKLLSEEDVMRIMDEFVTAARIAYEAGADGVDLKLCHGYLGSQILRPYNDRKWKYGGKWENRRKFAFDLIERVRDEVDDPDFILGSKISMWEGFPGGQGSAGPDTAVMDLSEPLDLIKGLEERGASFIMQSAGSPSITLALTQPDRKIPDDVYLHFTYQKRIKDTVKPETVVIGSAYSVLRNGKNNLQALDEDCKSLTYWGSKNIKDDIVDMIAIGRQSLADPKLPVKLKEERFDEINWCTCCDNCLEFLIRQKKVGCATYVKEYTQSLKQIRKEEGTLKEKRT